MSSQLAHNTTNPPTHARTHPHTRARTRRGHQGAYACRYAFNTRMRTRTNAHSLCRSKREVVRLHTSEASAKLFAEGPQGVGVRQLQ